MSSSFAKNAQRALYNTSNQQYGSVWLTDGSRPQKGIATKKSPTYSQVVESLAQFRRNQKLLKNELVNAKYKGIDYQPPKQKKHQSRTLRQFPVTFDKYVYPTSGLKIGNPIYRTNNMNYGSMLPSEFQIPNEFHPCEHKFSKGFLGMNFKYNGLNTAKTFSKVHNTLDQ